MKITTQETESEILMIETLLGQLKPNHIRQKRGIWNIWKQIELNKLIINNDKQFTPNSETFNVITELTVTVNKSKGDPAARKIRKERNNYIRHEL